MFRVALTIAALAIPIMLLFLQLELHSQARLALSR